MVWPHGKLGTAMRCMASIRLLHAWIVVRGNTCMGESMPTTLQAPHSVIGDYCAYLRVTHISTEQVRNASTGSRISIMAILQGLQKLSGFGERGG